MSETLIVSGKPCLLSLRNVWLCIIAQLIASWGIIASIFLPLFQEQPSKPEEVETYATRYRLMTPDPPRSAKSSMRRGRRAPSFDSFEYTETSVSWSQYNFLAPAERSASTTACYNGSSSRVRTSKINPAGRARSSSDPTGARGKAARRCMTIVADAATTTVAPARPIIRKCRSAYHRTCTFLEHAEDKPGMGTRTKSAFHAATKRTKHAFTRTTTVATSAATTKPQTSPPDRVPATGIEGTSNDAAKDEVQSGTLIGATVEEKVLVQSPRERRPKIIRKLTTFKKIRIFSRRRAAA